MAEVIIGATKGTTGYEHRGDIYNDDYNCAMFMATPRPTRQVPDWIADGYCQYPYVTNPPCISERALPTYNGPGTPTMRPGATTPAESMRCLPTAASSSSRTRSV